MVSFCPVLKDIKAIIKKLYKIQIIMKTRNIKISLSLFLLFSLSSIFAQTTEQANSGTLTVTADVVSKYIWRGQSWAGNGPHIQPTLSYAISGLEVGVTGSYGISNNYQEADPYVKYTTHGLTVQLTNFYIPYAFNGDNASADPRFYNFKAKTTASADELSLTYKGSESFPISIVAGTIVYGNDHSYGYKASLDKDSSNYFSTYVELGYTIKAGGQNVDVFGGLTPSSGFYGNGFGVVNLGVKGYRSVKITDSYSLPLYASLITNPQAERIYLVFGVTF